MHLDTFYKEIGVSYNVQPYISKTMTQIPVINVNQIAKLVLLLLNVHDVFHLTIYIMMTALLIAPVQHTLY